MIISPREIKRSYAVLKSIAQSRLNDGDINGAWEYIHHCVVLAEQFNWIYEDDDLERMEQSIGESIISQQAEKYIPNPNRVVVFDDFCLTYILVLQYILALLKANKEVLFISARPIQKQRNQEFFDYIKNLKGLTIKHIVEPDVRLCIKKIYTTIVDFKPSALFLQLYGTSPVIPVLYRLPKQIKSYLINQADQRFWLSARAIDYCIEFRPFGAAVSIERRGLKREQLLMLPFYPIYDKNSFEGFPKETEGRIVIFSGGDIYKTLDSKQTYWQLIKRILDTHPNVCFLFATKVNPLGSTFLDNFIAENHYEGRFIYVGFRKDIYETLRHCDIYMGTCPTSGSLMSQLAAINATPILQYYYPGTSDDETEQALCVNDQFQISFQDKEAFLKEADRLIMDVSYRKKKGKRIQAAMIQPEQFEKAVAQILISNTTPYRIQDIKVNYKQIDERWYESERCGLNNTLPYVVTLLSKNNLLKRVPSLYIKKQIRTLINLFK